MAFVVVRVNDRGPFLSDRLIDLSYTAAYKLDVLDGGSAWVEVETILPGGGAALTVAAAPTPQTRQNLNGCSLPFPYRPCCRGKGKPITCPSGRATE